MKYLKTFESTLQEPKYLIQLSSANSGRIMDNPNPSEYEKREAENRWSMGLDALNKIEIHQRYQHLPNDVLTKLIGCRNDIQRFGPSYLTDIRGLTEAQVRQFRYTCSEQSTYASLFSKTLNRFKKMNLEQKLVFFKELESDDYLIIRFSYIYKVVNESELLDEVMSISNKLDVISKENI